MKLLKTNPNRIAVCRKRNGAAISEMAVVLPVFFVLLFGFIEFGHVFMTIHTLNSAARRAARLGVGETATSDDVEDMAREILSSAIPMANVTIQVKDASPFDDPSFDASDIDYDALSDLEVHDADERQLFLVRVSVPYTDVGILGPRWLSGLNIYGQAVMRKE